jgi:hypothetical protein
LRREPLFAHGYVPEQPGVPLGRRMDRDDLGPIDVDLTEAGVDLGPTR